MTNLPDFSQFCEAACVKIWGEPQLRTPKQLRWSGNNGDNGYGARTYNVSKRTWYDHGAGRGGSTLELIAYSKGKPDEKLRGRAFIDMWKALVELDVGAPSPKKKEGGGGGKWPPILRTFPYHDENGALLFEIVRFDTTDKNKRFRPRRPDGKGGWIYDLEGVRPVLYRLPELIAAVKAGRRVLKTEGERDADTAVALGYTATTNPGGINKWRKEYSEFFRGTDVVVVSDNDEHGKGQADAAKITKRLAKVAARVRTIIFPQKDLTEWAEAGGTREQCDALIEQAPDQAKEPPPKEEEEPDIDAEEEAPDPDAEIIRLAKLSTFEYEQQRKGAAEKLDVRASILDRLVAAERDRLGLGDAEDGKQGQAISFPEIEPWPVAVDGAALLEDIAAAIRSHVVMSDHCRDINALWTVHTYLIKRFKISPKLSIRSPARRCGKTTLIEVLAELVFRAWTTGSITKAALFRLIDMWHPTLLIDEVDTFVGEDEELKGILNHGHRYDGAVTRTVGDDHEPRRFSVYAAVALSGIGGLAETLADRSVTSDLQRRRPSETIAPLRIGRMGHLHDLRRRITRWVGDHEERIAERDPEMPSIIDREADNWHILLAIADEAGGKWPERARKAAEAAHIAAANDPAARLEMLLGDIRTAFADNGTKMQDLFGGEQVIISSAKLVKVLVALEGRPWAETGKDRKPLTPNKLAWMLKPLGITSDKVGPERKRLAGYKLTQFEEAFSRYLPPEGFPNRTSGQRPANTGTSDVSKTDSQGGGCPDVECEKPNNDGPLSACPVQKGGKRTNAREAPKSKSDDMPYTGEPVDVPDQRLDPLDQHGAPRAANGPASEPGLSRRRIQELADWYSDETHRRYNDNNLNVPALDAELRAILREEVAFPEFVEIEFERVMDAALAGTF
jgi:putative DNA primase/helicase